MMRVGQGRGGGRYIDSILCIQCVRVLYTVVHSFVIITPNLLQQHNSYHYLHWAKNVIPRECIFCRNGPFTYREFPGGLSSALLRWSHASQYIHDTHTNTSNPFSSIGHSLLPKESLCQRLMYTHHNIFIPVWGYNMEAGLYQ